MMNLAELNWVALLGCVVVGQIFLTIWFVPLFGKPWARAYGVEDPKEHTKAVPSYTYGVGAICVFLLALGLASAQRALEVTTLADALGLGGFVALHFSIATALPGYAFLKRWPAFLMALGSQTVLILILSSVLQLWP